ncbi:MAG: GNAT family N-acetyltransferase [Marinobacter sp.]|uniref:GNAT family N-acetyltransferase n=1 Tax=Marinobacter sp. TaxID=50741 RepID=UPI00299F1D7C|nr:GNAT family N-acetyltransferase [Marinobacter sp.]MDX1756021.1 GNAT family N-acetyltransferase [Marinobacter sp.]
MQVTIRPAEPGDYEAVTDIAAAEDAEQSPVGNGRADFEALRQSPDHRVWVADAEGAVVGWLHAFLVRRVGHPPLVEIEGLTVSERFRRVGIGSRLIAEANAWAREQNLDIQMHCRPGSDYSHDFLRHHGYHFLKQQQVFEGNHM